MLRKFTDEWSEPTFCFDLDAVLKASCPSETFITPFVERGYRCWILGGYFFGASPPPRQSMREFFEPAILEL